MKNLGQITDPKDIPTKEYVDALGTRVSTNEDNIAMAESDIESLQTDVTTLKTDNTANQAAIKTLQDTYVPNTRKINNKSLDNDIALTASDVGAISQTSADDRYLKLTGGTIADNNDALNIAPYALEFSSTGVELSSSGTLNLSAVGQKEGVISGLANPTQDDHAANKAYVDTKATVHSYTASLSTTWTGTSAPYTQSISISGILSTDKPHITPVYSTTNATAILEKKAWNCISKAVTSAGKITFTCFEEKPTQALSLQIEVIR